MDRHLSAAFLAGTLLGVILFGLVVATDGFEVFTKYQTLTAGFLALLGAASAVAVSIVFDAKKSRDRRIVAISHLRPVLSQIIDFSEAVLLVTGRSLNYDATTTEGRGFTTVDYIEYPTRISDHTMDLFRSNLGVLESKERVKIEDILLKYEVLISRMDIRSIENYKEIRKIGRQKSLTINALKLYAMNAAELIESARSAFFLLDEPNVFIRSAMNEENQHWLEQKWRKIGY